MDLPPGTVYMGIKWTPEAWPLVKSEKLGGLSLGGRAVKVRGVGVSKAGCVLSQSNLDALMAAQAALVRA